MRALTLMAHAYSERRILLASLFFGLCVGNLLMLQPLLIAEAFGVRHYARIYGSSQLVTTLGVAAGPIMLGFLQDHFDYEVAYMSAAVASVVAFGLFVSAGPVRAASSAGSGRSRPARRSPPADPHDSRRRPGLVGADEATTGGSTGRTGGGEGLDRHDRLGPGVAVLVMTATAVPRSVS